MRRPRTRTTDSADLRLRTAGAVIGSTVDLDELRERLRVRGVATETWPERLELADELPRGSGGKVATAELRADLRRRMSLTRSQLHRGSPRHADSDRRP
ncbi:hypothetical protein GCM10010170_076720 [Dactylosporangium salmoneum]|uniref:AMP-binding enzyme C-terminal domain-containing protein n=1 Tax=Dactylosporangium salmoneum TaxID=53361 RepID=A0ABP5UBW6_9ACTN